MSYTYPARYASHLALPGDRAECGCHREWETGALDVCDYHQQEAEAEAMAEWESAHKEHR